MSIIINKFRTNPEVTQQFFTVEGRVAELKDVQTVGSVKPTKFVFVNNLN